MAMDPERVGLQNIEVPQVCDFGDNELDYLTRGGRAAENNVNVDVVNDALDDIADDVIADDVIADVSDTNIDDDDSDDDSEVSSSSDDTSCSMETESQNDYKGVLPLKFINFLKS